MVSVIIPTFNADIFIHEALESVENQTYKDYEVIVVDDGSTDRTREIVENQFPRARYFYIPNQGVAKARNFGIKKARGKFIAFLDADDVWLPEKLQKQVEALENDPDLMMVLTEQEFFDSSGIKPNPFSKREKLMRGDIVKNIFLFSYVSTPSVIVKRQVFEGIGFFEENMVVAEDDNLWLRIALNFKVELVDEVLLRVRMTPGSLSRSPDKLVKGLQDHICLIETKYHDLKKRLGWRCLQKKKSQLFFVHGYHLFATREQSAARQLLMKSFLSYPNSDSLLYLLLTFIPEKLQKALRDYKNKKQLNFLDH